MTSSQGPQTRDRQAPTWLIISLLVFLQAALTLGSFRTRDDILNDQPIRNVDFCSQYYWAQAAREFSAQDDRLWGYDPHFMAGYPLDFVFNSALPVQVAAVALRPLNLARLIKALFIGSFLLMPPLLFCSLSTLGLPRGPALAAAALGVCLFWISENALFGRFGMISGAFLLHFFLVPLALLIAWLRDRKPLALVLFGLALAFSLTVHKTAFVLTIAPAVMLTALSARSVKPREWAWLAAAFGLAFAVNLYWLQPFFRFLPLKVEDPATTFFQNTDLTRPLADLFPVQPFFAIPIARLLTVVAGIVGLRRLRIERPGLFLPLVALLGCFGVFAYFGSLVPALRHLQPYRYVSAYFYLWLPFAGYGLAEVRDRLLRSRVWAGRMAPAALGLFLFALLFLPSFQAFTWVAPLRTDLSADSAALVDWMKENTDDGARALAEDINVWTDQPVYGGARLVQLLPLLTGRELIGGPLPNAFIVHHRASFEDGRLCGSPIEEMTDLEIAEVLRRYNVGWIAAWSEAAKKRLTRLPGVEAAAEFGTVKCFRVASPPGYFIEGSGRVEASWNRIKLSGLSSTTGRVVVSYHWVDGLVSNPPARLVRVDVPGDPVGFIGIEDPPNEIEIRME